MVNYKLALLVTLSLAFIIWLPVGCSTTGDTVKVEPKPLTKHDYVVAQLIVAEMLNSSDFRTTEDLARVLLGRRVDPTQKHLLELVTDPQSHLRSEAFVKSLSDYNKLMIDSFTADTLMVRFRKVP